MARAMRFRTLTVAAATLLTALSLGVPAATAAAPAPMAVPAPAPAAAPVAGTSPAAVVPAEAGACREFSDVRPGSPAHAPVTWMACQGLTTGYADGTFGTSRKISRAETAAFLYRLADPAFTPPQESPFDDVVASRTSAFYAPIAWMSAEGIISGYTDGEFRPHRPITRGEAAKILFGTADPAYTAPQEKAFTDVTLGNPYHRHISWMKHVGASSGYADGEFRPSQHITRGEMAKLLWKTAPLLTGDTRPVPEPVAVPASFTVTGSGWGHGVGMSQYGARAMAAQGRSAAQILDFYYGPATVSNSTLRAAEDIRVHLHTARTAMLEGTRQVRVRDVGTTPGPVRLAVKDGRVAVTLPGGTEKTMPRAVVEWEGTRSWAGGASTLRVPQADGGARPLDLRHGRVEVTVVNGQLNIVNVLRMTDEYLYGLAEMPSSWGVAALQAQAVASRSYALRNLGTVKAACDCHVWDEVRSQKFTGWAKEDEQRNGTHWGNRWKAAVDATLTRSASGVPVRALSLWHGGAVADATYSSSNGGHTRNSGDVWSGSTVPYLTARPDPYSTSAAANNPNATWTQVITQADLKRVFGLQDVVSVRLAHGADGTPATLTATDTAGKAVTVSGRNVRADFGLKSAWVRSITAR